MAAIAVAGPSRPRLSCPSTVSATTTPPSLSCIRSISLKQHSSVQAGPVAVTPGRSPHKPCRCCGDGGVGYAPVCAWRVFLLDVYSLCYEEGTPSLHSFARWLSLFFSQVSLRDPVVAVLDGEYGSEYRRRLFPSYKARRNCRSPSSFYPGRARPMDLLVTDLLNKCHVPVVKVSGYEADDVIATLAHQVLEKALKVVIASPDKDFKQLVSENVQIVMPVTQIGRWSFYTSKHYMAQYGCDPSFDLSLRSILGDEADGIPGIQHLVPAFGRKTTLKLLKRHGSLEKMLDAAAVRTVGKAYVQDALTRHANYLRRNYEVLGLKRDIDIQLKESWLFERDSSNDSLQLSEFVQKLDAGQRQKHPYSTQQYQIKMGYPVL